MQVVIPDNNGTVHKLSEDILKKFNAYLSDSFQSCVKQEVTFKENWALPSETTTPKKGVYII